MGTKPEYIIEVKNCTKSFPGVMALKDVSLQVRRGEVHAIVGENGAGKSTIMKILAGMFSQDSGEILLDGEPFAPKSPADAIKKGISMIPQELDLFPDLTVAQNIFIKNELAGAAGILQEKAMAQKTQEILTELGLELRPNAKLRELSVAQMQMVAIVKATAFDAEVIIMDEPTSAITNREVDKLFEVIDKLRDQNKAILYISHKLDEIFQISDRVTVLRDGAYVDSRGIQDITQDEMVRMMVGRELKDMFVKTPHDLSNAPAMMQVKGLGIEKEFENISFDVKKGEILGVFGLMGAGRSEIMETIFGLKRAEQGEIIIHDKPVKIKSPKTAIQNGIAFITEDRKEKGLNLIGSVKNNISIVYLKEMTFGNLLLNFKKERELTKQYIEALKIKVSSDEVVVNNLSGGNQQKVVIAKWLLGDPDIIIMDEPTRGIDIGAKSEIYHILDDLAKEGKSIILISSEMPELLGMSDRVITVHEGKITGLFERDECDQEKLMACAVGGSKNGA